MSISICLLTSEDITDTFSRLSAKQVVRLLSQYRAANNGEWVPLQSVSSHTTEGDTLFLLVQAGQFGFAPIELSEELRNITALHTCIPPRESEGLLQGSMTSANTFALRSTDQSVKADS